MYQCYNYKDYSIEYVPLTNMYLVFNAFINAFIPFYELLDAQNYIDELTD